MADMTNTIEVDSAMPFAWAVDTALRSDTSSSFGASRLHSFASVVDSAIRSPASSFSASPVHALPFAIIRDPLPHQEPSSRLLHDSFDNLLNQRSFRVKGIDGEFDLCGKLGLSGPEDFAIPAAAWEEAQAHKARVVSPLAATVNLQQPRIERSAMSFTWAVDTALRSDTSSDFGASRLRSFASLVDSAIRSSPASSLRSWHKGEIIGRGTFGTVYEGITEDGYFFAVKEVSLRDDGSQSKQSIFQLQQEISLLSHFEHENIVQYLGTDMDNDKLYIFLELVTKGSLANLYQKYQLMDSLVSAYTRQILSGLKYLHDRNVVHRDIKCGNILVDANGSVKLADFGLANATKLNDVKSSKGSPYWMAPEVVNLRNRGYGLAADIWSLGCTVLEMLTRQPPYSHLEGMQALFRIGRGQPPPVPESLSTNARDFILKCLEANPDNRPTAAQLLDHPFVKRPLL